MNAACKHSMQLAAVQTNNFTTSSNKENVRCLLDKRQRLAEKISRTVSNELRNTVV